MTTLVWEAYDPVAAAAAADDSHSEMDVVIDFDTPNLPQPPPPPPPRHPSLAIPIFTPSNDSQTFVWRYGTEQKQNDEDSVMSRTSSGYFQTAGQQQEFNGGSGIITTKFATRFSEYRPEDYNNKRPRKKSPAMTANAQVEDGGAPPLGKRRRLHQDPDPVPAVPPATKGRHAAESHTETAGMSASPFSFSPMMIELQKSISGPTYTPEHTKLPLPPRASTSIPNLPSSSHSTFATPPFIQTPLATPQISHQVAHAPPSRPAVSVPVYTSVNYPSPPSLPPAPVPPPPSTFVAPPLMQDSSKVPRVGRKITPVSKDVPTELAEQPLDHLYDEVLEQDPTEALPTPKYKCKICLHVFPKKHTVVTHIKTHLGKRPFTCGQDGCKRTFVREHDRKRHEATHTGARPHFCPCGKEFSRLDALRRHSTYGKCPIRDPSLLSGTNDDAPEEGEMPPQKSAGPSKATSSSSSLPQDTRKPPSQLAAAASPPPSSQAHSAPAVTVVKRGRGRPRLYPATNGTASSSIKPPAGKKKKGSSIYKRPVGDGDSELDEDEDDRPRRRKGPSKAKAKGKKVSTEQMVDEDEEPEEPQLEYEEEDPSLAPSSFLFSVAGPQKQPSQTQTHVLTITSIAPTSAPGIHGPPLPPRSPSPPPISFVPAPTVYVPQEKDPYESITQHMKRAAFPLELNVVGANAVADGTFPTFRLKPVDPDMDIDSDVNWSDDEEVLQPITPSVGNTSSCNTVYSPAMRSDRMEPPADRNDSWSPDPVDEPTATIPCT